MEHESYFQRCRESVYDNQSNSFLLSKIASSEQENDLSVPPNCDGYGRIRHFRRFIAEDWGADPLPIDPCARSLGLDSSDMLKTQVFQIASCNVNCWYCFVPDALKHADDSKAKWFTCDKMVELFMQEDSGINIIDLSGGNPELVPEWILQTMKALEKRNLQDKIYLWSDDTLTTDYTFKYLTPSDLSYMQKYLNYGKVCCFKGYDHNSFSFNTKLPSSYFDKQFDLFSKYMELKLDLYGYVTFTTNNINDLEDKMEQFICKLRSIHPLLPLRIVPLKIAMFSPVNSRMRPEYELAIKNQILVYNKWRYMLNKLYETELLYRNICDIQLY